MKNKLSLKTVKRAGTLLFALPIMGIGVALCLKAGMGTDMYTTFQQGVSIHTNLNIGTVNLLMNASILFLFLFIDLKKVGVGSVIFSLGIGPSINVCEKLISISLPGDMSLYMNLFIMLIGIIFISISLAWYMQIDLGFQALDLMILTISRICNKPYGFGYMFFSGILFVGAFLLGGTIGIGTIINSLFVGKLVDLFTPWIKPMIRKLC